MTNPDTDDRPPTDGLHDLVARGDRACEGKQGGRLAEVAHLLGLCVAPPEQFELHEIEQLAIVDVDRAMRLWWTVSPGLRCKLFGDAPAPRVGLPR